MKAGNIAVMVILVLALGVLGQTTQQCIDKLMSSRQTRLDLGGIVDSLVAKKPFRCLGGAQDCCYANWIQGELKTLGRPNLLSVFTKQCKTNLCKPQGQTPYTASFASQCYQKLRGSREQLLDLNQIADKITAGLSDFTCPPSKHCCIGTQVYENLRDRESHQRFGEFTRKCRVDRCKAAGAVNAPF